MISQLFWQFLLLSLIAIGGANAVLPEMHRQIVEIDHWMTGAEFATLFAIAQAAPGPNVLIVSLVGWKMAGVPGALTATGAMCGPSSVLAYMVGKLTHHFKQSRARITIQLGLAPITIGIIMASGFLLAKGADQNLLTFAITLATIGLVIKTRVNPLWLLVMGAILGVVAG